MTSKWQHWVVSRPPRGASKRGQREGRKGQSTVFIPWHEIFIILSHEANWPFKWFKRTLKKPQLSRRWRQDPRSSGQKSQSSLTWLQITTFPTKGRVCATALPSVEKKKQGGSQSQGSFFLLKAWFTSCSSGFSKGGWWGAELIVEIFQDSCYLYWGHWKPLGGSKWSRISAKEQQKFSFFKLLTNEGRREESMVLKTMNKRNLGKIKSVLLFLVWLRWLKPNLNEIKGALSVTGPLVRVIRGVVSAYYTADGETTCAPPGYFRAWFSWGWRLMETKSSVGVALSTPALIYNIKNLHKHLQTSRTNA